MTAPTGEGFPKTARIRRRREFLAVGRRCERYQCAHFTVLARAREEGACRLGITVSRKVGGAVTRNLVKRRIRETFRRHPAHASGGRDLIVIAKPGAGTLSHAEMARELVIAMFARPSRPASRRL